MSIEAMKTALEAFDRMVGRKPEFVEQAITSLRQAIAEAEAEKPKCGAIIEVFKTDWRLEYLSLPAGKHKLYTQQYNCTTPPQRKPLTDETLWEMWVESPSDVLCFARAIEAAHGIKE